MYWQLTLNLTIHFFVFNFALIHKHKTMFVSVTYLESVTQQKEYYVFPSANIHYSGNTDEK